MPRKPTYYFLVQFTRVRDVDSNLKFKVTDIKVLSYEDYRKQRKELERDGYSLIEGPISYLRTWKLKKEWKRGYLVTGGERPVK